jgi:hypothetical protein
VGRISSRSSCELDEVVDAVSAVEDEEFDCGEGLESFDLTFVAANFGEGDQSSSAVCKGPYNHVTSESLSLWMK